MTLHGLVQSLDGKGGGKGDAGRQAMRKGRRGCDQGEATGAMGGGEGRAGSAGAPGTAPGGWTRGSRPQLGAAQCLFSAAGRQDRADIPLQDRVTVRLYTCPLTWRCDPQKAPCPPWVLPVHHDLKRCNAKKQKGLVSPSRKIRLNKCSCCVYEQFFST